MTHIGYVAAAYLISFGTLGLLAVCVIRNLRLEQARLDRIDVENARRGRLADADRKD